VPAFDLPVQARPVERGHSEIAEDEVVRLVLDLIERREPVGGGGHPVAVEGQQIGQQSGDLLLVVHDQDAEHRSLKRRVHGCCRVSLHAFPPGS